MLRECTVLVQQNFSKPCDLTVTETILVPHTAGNTFTRDLYLESSRMKVVNVDTTVRGISSNHTAMAEGSQFIINVATVPDTRPGTIRIKYVIENGVKNVFDYSSCTNFAANRSVLSWRSKRRNQRIDVLKFCFQSAGSILVVDDSAMHVSTVNSTTIDTKYYNVFERFYTYSYTSDSHNCPVNFTCLENEPEDSEDLQEGKQIGIIAMWIIFAIVCPFICICCCCAQGNESQVGGKRKPDDGWAGNVYEGDGYGGGGKG